MCFLFSICNMPFSLSQERIYLWKSKFISLKGSTSQDLKFFATQVQKSLNNTQKSIPLAMYLLNLERYLLHC